MSEQVTRNILRKLADHAMRMGETDKFIVYLMAGLNSAVNHLSKYEPDDAAKILELIADKTIGDKNDAISD